MPGGMGGGGTINTSQSSNVNMGPWNEQGPYLKQGFGQAGGLLSLPALNQWQNTGLSGLYNQALTNPVQGVTQQTWADTMAGKYLDPSTNPWLQKTFEAASQPVAQQFQNITAPTTDAMFGAAGPMSGGARFNAQNMNQQNLARALDQLATGIYGGNYQAERQNQMGAMAFSPQMQQMGYVAPEMAYQAGTLQQNAPWDQLARYMGIVGSQNWGQSGSTQSYGQQPYFSSPLSTGLGALLGLGSLAIPGLGGTSALGNIFGGLGGLFGGRGIGSAAP